MKIINIKSIPIDKVIKELGTALKAEVIENCEEYFLKIPFQLGKGFIRGVSFRHGLGFIQYACNFKEDLELHFVQNDVHPLKFIYLLDGLLLHRFEKEKEDHFLEKYQHCIVASKAKVGHVIKFHKNSKILINSLEINRKIFLPKMECSISKMGSELEGLFKDVNATESYYYKGYYNLSVADLFQQVQEFKGKLPIRKIFLEGIVFQMLYHELRQYYSEKEKNEENFLRRSEVNAIKEAELLIENEVSNLPSIKKIGYRVGLNTNKLQLGFKHLHGTTVNGFVKRKRLEFSKGLLLKTDLNMAEISEKVGLTSKSYFSKIFKEAYSITPTEYRKKNIRNKSHAVRITKS